MNLFPTKRNASSASTPAAPGARADDGLGRGMEFAIVVLAFLGVGYLLDRWFDTKPVFMIVLVVLSLVGQFASMWYGYDSRMQQLEAERRERTTGAARPGKSAPFSADRAAAERAARTEARRREHDAGGDHADLIQADSAAFDGTAGAS
jgi:ATP synthase protein I